LRERGKTGGRIFPNRKNSGALVQRKRSHWENNTKGKFIRSREGGPERKGNRGEVAGRAEFWRKKREGGGRNGWWGGNTVGKSHEKLASIRQRNCLKKGGAVIRRKGNVAAGNIWVRQAKRRGVRALNDGVRKMDNGNRRQSANLGVCDENIRGKGREEEGKKRKKVQGSWSDHLMST